MKVLVLAALIGFALGQEDDGPKRGMSSQIPAPFKPRCMGSKPCNLPAEQKAILGKAMDTLEVAAKAMGKEVVREPSVTGCLNDCSYHGQCIHGECESCGPAYCQCNPGFTGADCSERTCHLARARLSTSHCGSTAAIVCLPLGDCDL